MKLLIALATIVLVSILSAPAHSHFVPGCFQGVPMLMNPHCLPGHPGNVPPPSNNGSGSGGSPTGDGGNVNWFQNGGGAAWGGGCFVSQLAHFIAVGIVYNRVRTDKEVEANMAFCSVVGIPLWVARWGDGTRVPKPMPDTPMPRYEAWSK
jgi:hypothetical protein